MSATIDQFRQLLAIEPFRPFVMRLKDGRSFAVKDSREVSLFNLAMGATTGPVLDLWLFDEPLGSANVASIEPAAESKQIPIHGDLTISTMTPTQPIAVPPVADVYRMNIDEFERIAGYLDVERVELIDGILVERGDMDPPHAVAGVRLRFYLDRLAPGGWFVREDKPRPSASDLRAFPGSRHRPGQPPDGLSQSPSGAG